MEEPKNEFFHIQRNTCLWKRKQKTKKRHLVAYGDCPSMTNGQLRDTNSRDIWRKLVTFCGVSKYICIYCTISHGTLAMLCVTVRMRKSMSGKHWFKAFMHVWKCWWAAARISQYVYWLAKPLDVPDMWNRFPASVSDFRVLKRVLISSWSHPASYPRRTGALPLGARRRRREFDYKFPSSAEVTNPWNYTSVPYMPSFLEAWLSTGTTLPYCGDWKTVGIYI
jgi:hypothetical protein